MTFTTADRGGVTRMGSLERKVRVARVVIERVTIVDSLERKVRVARVVIERVTTVDNLRGK